MPETVINPSTPPSNTTSVDNSRSSLNSTFLSAFSLRNIRQATPAIGLYLLAGLLVGTWRFLSFSQPLDWILNTVFFLIGILIGHFLFIFEKPINNWIDWVGNQLADEEDTNVNTFTNSNNHQPKPASTSWLRQVLILLILPILGFYLVSSSPTPLGLGLLFGISSVYMADIVRFLRGISTKFVQTYFKKEPTPQQLQATAWFYVIYFLLLILMLVIWR